MKPFKTLGGLAVCASALFLVTSCSKNLEDQVAKDESAVSQATSTSSSHCPLFVGIKIKHTSADPDDSYIFTGNQAAPLASSPIFGSDLICFSATGGSPFLQMDYNRIGVGDRWIHPGESLTLTLCGSLASSGANAFQMLFAASTSGGGKAMVDFYDDAEWVDSKEFEKVTGGLQFFQYESLGDTKDFNKVVITGISGGVALTGYTPNNVTPGPGGFFLTPAVGEGVILRMQTGTTMILGTPYANQYINFIGSYGLGINLNRQNRDESVAETLPGSGEFPAGIIPGSDHWLDVVGSAPLAFKGANSFRLGVGDIFMDPGETITFTPGPDFPTGKFRSVQIREAVLPLPATQGVSIMKIEIYDGATLVGTEWTSGYDQAFTQVNSFVPFDKVVVSHVSGSPSLGRPTPGTIGAVVKLIPACL